MQLHSIRDEGSWVEVIADWEVSIGDGRMATIYGAAAFEWIPAEESIHGDGYFQMINCTGINAVGDGLYEWGNRVSVRDVMEAKRELESYFAERKSA